MGISGVNSNLATAIRTVVVVFMAWGIVFITNAQSGIGDISRKVGCFDIVWACYWCFVGYFIIALYKWATLQKVASIDKFKCCHHLDFSLHFLNEQLTLKSMLGCLLIVAGSLLMIL